MTDDDLIHELLLGRPSSDSQREYPSGAHERTARIALANAIRRRDEFALQIVADMIDPRTDSAIIKRKVEFVPARDRRLESKTADRLDLEIATFMHDWIEKHPGRGSIARAVDAAIDYFHFEERKIRDVWKAHKFKGKLLGKLQAID